MRLLVLGSSGFLGAHLVLRGAEAFSAVVAACRDPEAAPPAPHPARVRLRRWDATLPGATEVLLTDERPDAVINACALSRLRACADDPERARLLNSALPQVLGERSARHGFRLLHVSTDLVFGGRPPRGERFDESDPPAPLSTYGRSKAEGEERLLEAAPAALVVRLPLLYGDSFGRGLGASDALETAWRRGERPRLFSDEWRTPLDVDDAARALVELATSRVDGEALAGLLHVAGPARLNRYQLGLLVAGRRALDAATDARRIEESSRVALGLERERPADVSLDASRARTLLRTRLRSPMDCISGCEDAPSSPPA